MPRLDKVPDWDLPKPLSERVMRIPLEIRKSERDKIFEDIDMNKIPIIGERE